MRRQNTCQGLSASTRIAFETNHARSLPGFNVMASLESVTGPAEAVDTPLYFDSAGVNGRKFRHRHLGTGRARTNFLTEQIKAPHR